MRRWLARNRPEVLYERLGARYITRYYALVYASAVAFGAPIVLLPLVLATTGGAGRYAIAFAAGTSTALLALWLGNRRATRRVAPALEWDADAGPEATIAAWRATVSSVPSDTVATFAICQLVSGIPWAILVSELFDLSVLEGFVCAACVAVLTLYPTVALTAGYELFLRPLRQDLARRLPPDYRIERPSPSLRLWLIALVPTVLVVNTLIAVFASTLDGVAARLALSLLVALALTLLATLLIARLILGPIGELTRVTSRIRAGDLSARAVPEREDELGALVLEFNRMSDELVRAREHLVTAREEERRRLRRDLHDGLGAAIAAVSVQLQAALHAQERDPQRVGPLIAGASDAVHDALEDVRRLVYGLRPPALDAFGLLGALRHHATSLGGPGAPSFEVAGDELGALPAAVEVAALRIAQEAMTNVVRHAQARSCVVELSCNGTLMLSVRDDGVGYTGEASGVGLVSMRERAGELGGSVSVSAAPGGGTEVVALLPADAPAA
jgi:signal transduction histidine kinase